MPFGLYFYIRFIITAYNEKSKLDLVTQQYYFFFFNKIKEQRSSKKRELDIIFVAISFQFITHEKNFSMKELFLDHSKHVEKFRSKNL